MSDLLKPPLMLDEIKKEIDWVSRWMKRAESSGAAKKASRGDLHP
ncbi:MAG: hypothetical protein QXI19_12060 [Candidatus Caldarchaeum sp.]